jgi:hypothetical protein
VRPYCPRAGRGAPRRFEKPGRFFSSERFGLPGGSGGTALKGLTPPDPLKSLAARPRGAGGGLSDAIRPVDGADAVAALDRRLTAALGEEAARTLAAAENVFRCSLGFLAAWQRCERGKPSAVAGRLGHLPTVRRLLWVLQRLDRYACMGEGRKGAGLEVLGQRIATHRRLIDEGVAVIPAHLGYFLPILEEEARRWKHTWAPRIKDQRIAAGRPPPPMPPRRRWPGGEAQREGAARSVAASCR